MGAELCLAHDIGGWRHWGPLLVDMQPYGCFIVSVVPWTEEVKLKFFILVVPWTDMQVFLWKITVDAWWINWVCLSLYSWFLLEQAADHCHHHHHQVSSLLCHLSLASFFWAFLCSPFLCHPCWDTSFLKGFWRAFLPWLRMSHTPPLPFQNSGSVISALAKVQPLAALLGCSRLNDAASPWGSNHASSFFAHWSAADIGSGSLTGFKNQGGIFSCTIGCTTALSTNLNVSESVIFTSDERFVVAMLMWAWASLMLSNVAMISAFSSALCFCSGRWHRNSSPDGISSSGSTASTTLGVTSCHKCRHAGSFIVWITRSGSALAMDGQFLNMTCFSVLMVIGRVSFLSSFSKTVKLLKILFILSWYTLTSLGFWGPTLGQALSLSMTTGSSCEAMTRVQI